MSSGLNRKRNRFGWPGHLVWPVDRLSQLLATARRTLNPTCTNAQAAKLVPNDADIFSRRRSIALIRAFGLKIDSIVVSAMGFLV